MLKASSKYSDPFDYTTRWIVNRAIMLAKEQSSPCGVLLVWDLLPRESPDYSALLRDLAVEARLSIFEVNTMA